MATARGRIYAAIDSFVYTDENGHFRRVEAGELYREGHELLKGKEHLFELDNGPKVKEVE